MPNILYNYQRLYQLSQGRTQVWAKRGPSPKKKILAAKIFSFSSPPPPFLSFSSGPLPKIMNPQPIIRPTQEPITHVNKKLKNNNRKKLSSQQSKTKRRKQKTKEKKERKERKVRALSLRGETESAQRVKDPLTHPVMSPSTPMPCRHDACESKTYLDLATQQLVPTPARPICHRRSHVFPLIFSFKT